MRATDHAEVRAVDVGAGPDYFSSLLERIRLRVFLANGRARRFYEKLGWRPTGQESKTAFPPYPTLLEYGLDLER
jgi:hypothetical protein